MKWLLCFLLALPWMGVGSQSKEIPNFAMIDVDGNRQVFYQILDGLPEDAKVILNFTSIHCKPCEKEIPELLEIEKSVANVKLFCIFAEPGELAKPKAKSLGLSIAYSDPIEKIQGIFGVKEYPTTVVVSANGKKLSTFVGYNEKQRKALRKFLGLE